MLHVRLSRSDCNCLRWLLDSQALDEDGFRSLTDRTSLRIRAKIVEALKGGEKMAAKKVSKAAPKKPSKPVGKKVKK